MIHDFMRVLVDGIGYGIGRNQDLIVANLGQAVAWAAFWSGALPAAYIWFQRRKAWVTPAPADVTSLGG
jgi:hypothetical protein